MLLDCNIHGISAMKSFEYIPWSNKTRPEGAGLNSESGQWTGGWTDVISDVQQSFNMEKKSTINSEQNQYE